ncbi:protein DOG1-like 3 [Tasmannia lanceolata]|uniref:protein DOG1-like 3 n=1 Tax=Tasmannia lanceolata TaxID=3420 RepID=UPI0040633CAA
MSPLPNEDINGEQHLVNFKFFFEQWIVEQDRYLQELLTASREDYEDEQFQPLISRVLKHYESYYENKSRAANLNIVSMLSPHWTSTLEDAFLWIGGWRPSLAFHLLYSKAGIQLESQLKNLLNGMITADLGDLSASQLSQVDELQRRMISEERDITEKMAKQQETVADSEMVELAHVVTEMRREGQDVVEDLVESKLKPKKEGLEEVLERADDLRLRTLRGVIVILRPLQAAHYLIAAAELHLRVHEWGMKMDAVENGDDIV